MTSEQYSDHYGTELTLRLVGIADRGPLDDGHALGEFLRRMVAAVGMRIIAGPAIGSEDGSPQRAGHSAVVILAESHAAVHTYPGLGELFFNLFSCKPFAEETVFEQFREFVGDFTVLERTSVRRGEDWPRAIERAVRHWHDVRLTPQVPSPRRPRSAPPRRTTGRAPRRS
ncbi:S-adenosylmethionine decarboxylase [Micromonospora sp. NBC_00617]|uniref:S-adenosylmethionine decarboxylase n=1 Tax=Micromonospora sp. NBC_00617 TaxID=2903587 RepID=UPI0030E1A1F2